MAPVSELITAREAARRLKVTRARVSTWILNGKLPAQKVGRDWIIEVPDLEKIHFNPVRRHRLTPEQIIEIQDKARQKMTIAELAREYQVSDRTIYRHLK